MGHIEQKRHAPIVSRMTGHDCSEYNECGATKQYLGPVYTAWVIEIFSHKGEVAFLKVLRMPRLQCPPQYLSCRCCDNNCEILFVVMRLF